MKNIKKIILAAHPLRNYGKYVAAWLPNLFSYQVAAVTNLPTYTLVTPNFYTLGIEENLIQFDYVKFFSFYGINYSKNSWGELYYNCDYNKEAYEYVQSVFKDSLVISYEMDACILNILDYFKIPYIDMYISPVRFMEDQLFSITSNFEDVYKKILQYKLPEEQIYLHANYLITFYRQKYCNKIQRNKAVLFIGQTAFDRSLIHPKTGEIYSILNHKDVFREAVDGYSKILYKRHPKASNDSPVLEYLKTLGDVEIVEDNFYEMCSRPDIQKVVAISSGGLIEAKYFGKETQALLHPSVNLQDGTGFDKEKYINVYEHFFSLHFWADVLSSIIDTKDFPPEIGFYGSKNKLRNSRGYKDWWGYQDFDHEMSCINNNKKEDITPFFSSIDFTKFIRFFYHLTYNKNLLSLYEKIKNK